MRSMTSKSRITCHGAYGRTPQPFTTRIHGWIPDRPLRWGDLIAHPTVLDSSIGKPAQGVKVQLLAPTVQETDPPASTHAGVWAGIGSSVTNADGRCLDLLPPDSAESTALRPGTYQIVFETKEYFERTSRKSFYPFVQVGSS